MARLQRMLGESLCGSDADPTRFPCDSGVFDAVLTFNQHDFGALSAFRANASLVRHHAVAGERSY